MNVVWRSTPWTRSIGTPVENLLACGASVPATTSQESKPIVVTVSRVDLQQNHALIRFKISERVRGQVLGLPIQPVPPTAVLDVNGKVVATEAPASPSIAPPLALGKRLNASPYVASADVVRACSGFDFSDLRQAAGNATIVMTDPNWHMATDADRHLLVVSAPVAR